jgi:hypothetical protein
MHIAAFASANSPIGVGLIDALCLPALRRAQPLGKLRRPCGFCGNRDNNGIL